jgi:hypothetical protein
VGKTAAAATVGTGKFVAKASTNVLPIVIAAFTAPAKFFKRAGKKRKSRSTRKSKKNKKHHRK